MNTHIVLQVVSPAEIVSLSSLRGIYESSFPTDERRVFDSVVKLAGTEPDFNFYAIMRDNEPIGLFSSWDMGKFLFVEHFAVSPKYRGWGIGQQVLETWLAGQTLPVVLEVERPEDDITRRRVGFYERVGFRHWAVDYLQPAYSIDKNPVPMHLMTYGNIDLNELLAEVQQRLYQKVYAGTLQP